MPHFSAQQLQDWTGGQWYAGTLPAHAVCGFTQDTRELRQGMCFVALKTGRRDGHDFLPAAQQAGAAMALVSRASGDCPLPQLVVADPLRAFQQIATRHRQQFSAPLIGVSGSCGKTSTKNMLRTLLGEHCHATRGNLNNFIGVPLTLLELEPTQHTAAVIEAGISEPGEMDILADMIRPDVVVLTMIGPAHLECLKSVEAVAAEKTRLAKAFTACGSVVGSQHASDAERAEAEAGLSPQAPERKILPLLLAPLECWQYPAFAALPNECIAVAPEGGGAQPQSAGSKSGGKMPDVHYYKLQGQGRLLSLRGARLQGDFPLGFTASEGMASNLALALLAAHACGIAAELLLQRVRSWQPTGNRGQWQRFAGREKTNFFVDCYNANPASMQDSLSFFVRSTSAGAKPAADELPAAAGLPASDELPAAEPSAAGLSVTAELPAAAELSVARVTGEASSAAAGFAQAGLPRLFVLGGMRELGEASAQWHQKVGEHLGRLLAGSSAAGAIGQSQTGTCCGSGIAGGAGVTTAAIASAGHASAGDSVILIGTEADNAALAAGIRKYAPGARLHCFAQTAQAQALVDAFCGNVFLKGSRFYALETLLPPVAPLPCPPQ